MVDDILDKIMVPDSKSTKGDVFKEEKDVPEEEKTEKKKEKEEKYKEKELKKEKPKYHFHEKKEIFGKEGFDRRKPVVFNIKQPGWVERSIFIVIILILGYFAFFQNININLDFSHVFGDNVQPLVVKEAETGTTEEEAVTGTSLKETELSGEITLTVDDVKTEKYDTGVSKITGFTFTIDNQKEVFDAKILYYGYDDYTPDMWTEKPRGEEVHASVPIGKKTYSVETSIVFTNAQDKTMKFELVDMDNEETIANITKEVAIN